MEILEAEDPVAALLWRWPLPEEERPLAQSNDHSLRTNVVYGGNEHEAESNYSRPNQINGNGGPIPRGVCEGQERTGHPFIRETQIRAGLSANEKGTTGLGK